LRRSADIRSSLGPRPATSTWTPPRRAAPAASTFTRCAWWWAAGLTALHCSWRVAPASSRALLAAPGALSCMAPPVHASHVRAPTQGTQAGSLQRPAAPPTTGANYPLHRHPASQRHRQ
jgi:hypothetical protein